MKYFTPELFVRLQECQTPAAFRPANAEWERALEAYRARLQEIARDPDERVGRLLMSGSLHDAEVIDIGTCGSELTIVLRKQGTPGLLLLTYGLVEPPWTSEAALPEAHRSTPTLWPYDEIDRDAEGGMAPTFRHAILLDNGWEIRLRFHRLTVTQTTSLFPPVAAARPDQPSLSHSG
jgi:hypothetical protein